MLLSSMSRPLSLLSSTSCSTRLLPPPTSVAPHFFPADSLTFTCSLRGPSTLVAFAGASLAAIAALEILALVWLAKVGFLAIFTGTLATCAGTLALGGRTSRMLVISPSPSELLKSELLPDILTGHSALLKKVNQA